MTAYRVEVTRDGKWWMVAIPEVDGLTQARRLEEAPLMARDYIAVSLDVPIEEVDVAVAVIDVDGINILDAITKLEAERAEAEAARDQVAEDTRRLAQTLAGKKIPVRDIGAILGVSHQRAHQLVG
ncbi:HicB family toxin-antitoxin system [Pseudolysinimonas yzui]|nr:HicB family toxin-antitoxin system [Pseudolysinimonas yzui]